MKKSTRFCLANTVCIVCQKEEVCREDCHEITCLGRNIEATADVKQDIPDEITVTIKRSDAIALVEAIGFCLKYSKDTIYVSQITRNRIKKALE